MLPLAYWVFLSTPSARRATACAIACDMAQRIFLSTPSARRATCLIDIIHAAAGISIHALREEGDLAGTRPDVRKSKISIHALREEGDPLLLFLGAVVQQISIHALREEGDSKNGEKHLRFCFTIKRSAQIWKSLSKNIRKKSRDLHRMP